MSNISDELLIKIAERLARIEERMDQWDPAGEGASCKEHQAHMAAMDVRLAAIEKSWWTLSGKVAGLMLGASFLGGILVKWLLG